MLNCKSPKSSANRIIQLILAMVATTAMLTSPLKAEEQTKVVVLPFHINATDDLSYLSEQIATVLAQHLENDGAVIIGLEDGDKDAVLKASDRDMERIRDMARQYGADHVVWGSFTKIGDSFSLDARLMAAAPARSPDRFFTQGRSLEMLPSVSRDLARQMGLKLFAYEMVSEIRIQGNERIESDAILRMVKTQKGNIFKPKALSDDLRAIHSMGYFDDLKAEAESGPEGKIITIHVKEKPTIRRIKIKGNSYIDEEDIEENLTISTGAIMNIFKIRSNMDQIEALYKEKNYHNVKIDYKIVPLPNNQADLEFEIDEGSKIFVTEIRMEGNNAFESKKLRKELETSEKGFFSWLTDSGNLDRTELDQDVARISAFYQNQGYINARVGEPQIDINDDGIIITFKIDEGPQFKVGKVDVQGDLIVPKTELLDELSIAGEEYFNREKVRNDVMNLTDLYANHGYAYANISPKIDRKSDVLMVDITFRIQKRQQVYFENIIISGNTRTRDKVIRRELPVNEQGLFNNEALKRGIRNLYRLEYFEDIKVDTLKGSADDKMLLKIDVTEKSTGTFSVGAGYSGEEGFYGTGSVSERNLFGRGQTLSFNGQLGGRTTLFSLRFTEPWMFDKPLSGSLIGYNEKKSYTSYLVKRMGGGFTLGYRLWDYTYLRGGYSLESSDTEIEPGEEDSVSDNIKELEGTNVTSSINTSLTYDSRDRQFDPSQGSKQLISLEYAGLGGTIGFNKYIGQTMWYKPLFWKLVGFANAKIGYVHKNDPDKLLPDYEKFYLGGINSLRGFGFQGVSLFETNSNGELVKVGGEKMAQINLEIIFPITPEMGVNGVVFFDTGNVYEGDIDFSDMRQSAGCGIRWLSPMAPIQIFYGWILDKREGESSGQFEFTMGGSF